MTLTGKCKEDFEEWFYSLDRLNDRYFNSIEMFYRIPQSMRCGVYVDWFDSVGMTVLINTESTECWWGTILEEGIMSPYFKTRHEALTSAIEKANKIHNKQNK
jgi:hypothetical protein